MKKTWTDNEVELLKTKFSISTNKELVELIPKHTLAGIRAKAKKFGLKRTPETLYRIRTEYNQNWNKEMVSFIKENYHSMTYIQIAEKLGIGKSMLANKIRILGLKGKVNKSLFKKGDVPFNKGLSWNEFMSEQGKINSSKTTFKKGHTPKNHRNVGDIRHQADGYWYIKVAEPRTWKQLHHVIYMQHNPDFILDKNTILEFKDGNRDNINIDNIIVNTRQKSAARAKNSDGMIVAYLTKDKDLQRVILEKMPELIQAKRQLIELNKSLKNLQNDSIREKS